MTFLAAQKCHSPQILPFFVVFAHTCWRGAGWMQRLLALGPVDAKLARLMRTLLAKPGKFLSGFRCNRFEEKCYEPYYAFRAKGFHPD